MGETWDTYSKKLFRHVVHLGLPPAPAVRRTREPSLRAPEVRSTDAANGRLTHTTGHRSAATLVVSSASAPTCDYHTPHSPLPKPHLPVWSPCSISRRLWPAGRAPAPRGCTDNGSDNARSTHNAARTRVTTTRTAHRCRVRHAELLHPPLRRHHRRTPVAASAVSGPVAPRPRRPRSVLRIGRWALSR